MCTGLVRLPPVLKGRKAPNGHKFCPGYISETSGTVFMIRKPDMKARWPRIWTDLIVLSQGQNNSLKKGPHSPFFRDVSRILTYRFALVQRHMKAYAPKISFLECISRTTAWTNFHDTNATLKSFGHRCALIWSLYPQNCVHNVCRRPWSRFSWLKSYMKARSP